MVHDKHTQLKACYDYLQRNACYPKIIKGIELKGAVSHALASAVITRINSLVLAEEDRKLETAIKKMSLEKPAVAAGSQAPPNDLSELKKMVGDLAKKVDLQSKKVCDNLYHLLCVCAGHLSLTPPLLRILLIDVVKSGWEEVQWETGQGEKEEGCHNRKQKGQSHQSHQGHSHQGQGQRQGQRLRCEVKAAGQQEEGWQEVSASFRLLFGTDSASACSVSCFGPYEFSDLYCLDWVLLITDCRFLCLSFPPSCILNTHLCSLIQLSCLVYALSTASPKFNIFDHMTYPDLSVKLEQDFLFMVFSRFAPQWLLGSRRFTN